MFMLAQLWRKCNVYQSQIILRFLVANVQRIEQKLHLHFTRGDFSSHCDENHHCLKKLEVKVIIPPI